MSGKTPSSLGDIGLENLFVFCLLKNVENNQAEQQLTLNSIFYNRSHIKRT